MKTNKKAILGMLVAMVMSLGVMQGINAKSNDFSLQQVGAGYYYMSGETSGGTSALCSALGSFSTGVGAGLLVAVGTNAWNPGGWIAGGLIAGYVL